MYTCTIYDLNTPLINHGITNVQTPPSIHMLDNHFSLRDINMYIQFMGENRVFVCVDHGIY